EPRAMGHIPEMIELIKRLLDKGHAYVAGNDVYFDVRSFADRYGRLSNHRLEHMRPAGDTENESLKRHRRDSAPWKRAKQEAPRVLGHGDQVPRRDLRHPRRRG